MNPHRSLSQLMSLRPAALKGVLLCALAVACAAWVVTGVAQSRAGEREVHNKVPAHLPIKVKVKNEEKVKDLGNEKWLGDIEIEVTNKGSKPIYYLYLLLTLPDVQYEGATMGYQLVWGRSEFISITEMARPDDEALLPGESVTLKVERNSVAGWELGRKQGLFPDAKKLKVHFRLLNFGDGTGLSDDDGRPLPSKRRSTNRPRREGAEKEAMASDRPPGGAPGLLPQLSPYLLPASFLPAKFLPAKMTRPSAQMC
jgi:hypothetical protein